MKNSPPRFAEFTRDFTALADRAYGDEATMLSEGGKLLAKLVARDDWLPERYAQPHPQYYQQYLLHLDAQERFSVVSFVWGPGQKTPLHNHTVWALIGMLRGSERAENFALGAPGEPMRALDSGVLTPGMVESLSPPGDIHRVSNVYDDRVSISVHVYGGNIGRVARHVFDGATSTTKPFTSGYSNEAELAGAC